MEKNIIFFKKAIDKFCKHLNVLVDPELNIIICEKCGVQLNPVQYLYKLECEQERIEYKLDLLKKQQIYIEEIIKNRIRTK